MRILLILNPIIVWENNKNIKVLNIIILGYNFIKDKTV
ncbi:hypothetical protein CLSA_c32630 [Clostridium saccharobutylicum DSM 13864]|uniref:Uncharacterized protein n=1 Tax=Clostridium saccharobutylicum DSM 13864 TaxID=1345695 RepID=U5MXN8_CLOSA|nr:hypothetical protein CLSA_c32630 [Clostridium saccharobutylicum DSM 13864]